MTSSVLENIKAATQGTVDAINAWHLEALVALRSEDFIFQGLPSSLNLPPMTNAQYADMWTNMMTPSFQSFKITPHTIMHDAETKKSTVYAAVNAQTAGGPATWDLVMMMTFSENGENLVRLDEFFDSKSYLDLMATAQGNT